MPPATFLGPVRAVLALVLAALLLVPAAVRAADLPVVVASPGTLYELGPFERRGVLILEGATLEIRADGCWRTDMLVVNGNPEPRTVSVSYRWYGSGGRPIASIPAISRAVLSPGVRTPLSANGCSNQIARSYRTLAATSVVRLMSVGF